MQGDVQVPIKGARLAFGLAIFLEIAGWIFIPHIASDFTWLGLVVTAAFAWGAAEALRVSAFPFWLIFAATVLDGASALFQLYSKIEPWDQWVHAWGGLVIAVGAIKLIRRGLRKEHIAARRHGPFIAVSVYLLVAGIGFLYEFWEYLVDRLQYGYPKSLVSAYDSVEDQLFNLLGATVALILYWLWTKRRASRSPERA